MNSFIFKEICFVVQNMVCFDQHRCMWNGYVCCSCWIRKVKVSVSQSCPVLCDPMDYRPLGSSVPVTLQARILEWVAIPFPRGYSWPRDQTWVFRTAGRFYRLSHWGSLLLVIVLCNCKIKLVDSVVQISFVLLIFHLIVL